MILIISHNQVDEPTNDVIEWLRYYKVSFKRLNGDVFKFGLPFEINIDESNIKFGDEMIRSEEVSAIFYRRWKQSPYSRPLYLDFIKNKTQEQFAVAIKEYTSFLWYEFAAIRGTVNNSLNHKYWIPHHTHVSGGLNKINLLKKARMCGLYTPDTIITSSKEFLQRFKEKHNNIINKCIDEVEIIVYNEHLIDMYTKEITDLDIQNMPDVFFPSLFQKNILKECEIRTFFIEDDYYSMAIFSQNDEKTKTDFRNYNLNKPNRCIPFKLPDAVTNKLKSLMKMIDLNTGSMDLLLCVETKKFYFLEVNPVGQLGMVSANCNYHLEEKIAINLKKHEESYG